MTPEKCSASAPTRTVPLFSYHNFTSPPPPSPSGSRAEGEVAGGSIPLRLSPTSNGFETIAEMSPKLRPNWSGGCLKEVVDIDTTWTWTVFLTTPVPLWSVSLIVVIYGVSFYLYWRSCNDAEEACNQAIAIIDDVIEYARSEVAEG